MSVDVSLLKEELRTLYEEKTAMEQEIEESLDMLSRSGVGLEGALVDSEV